MRLIRYTTAIILSACTVPVLCMALAWGLASLSGCRIDLEAETACRLGSYEIGRLIDGAVSVGIFSALSAGLAAFVFAAWVMIELMRIIIRSH